MAFTIEDIRKIFVEENTKLEEKLMNSMSKLTEELHRLNTTINEQNIAFNIRLNSMDNKMLQFEANTFESTSAINGISTEIVDLKQENTDLKNKIDDIINRNMRSNLVFTNVPETEGNQFDSTRQLLVNLIERNLKEDSYKGFVVRAHRGKPAVNGKPRVIICKMARDDIADEIDYKFANLGQQRINNIRCSKQFSPELQQRRNQALFERKKLKENNEISKGYIKYPAALMVCKPNEKTHET